MSILLYTKLVTGHFMFTFVDLVTGVHTGNFIFLEIHPCALVLCLVYHYEELSPFCLNFTILNGYGVCVWHRKWNHCLWCRVGCLYQAVRFVSIVDPTQEVALYTKSDITLLYIIFYALTITLNFCFLPVSACKKHSELYSFALMLIGYSQLTHVCFYEKIYSC